jgi:hypothetical protein
MTSQVLDSMDLEREGHHHQGAGGPARARPATAWPMA